MTPNQQAFIKSLLEKAVDDWNNGAEVAFKLDKEAEHTRVDYIWNMGLNALAYGLEYGMGLGYEIAHAEMEDGAQTPHLDAARRQVKLLTMEELYNRLSEEKKKRVLFLIAVMVKFRQNGESEDGGHEGR